jgi:hypothetical protein
MVYSVGWGTEIGVLGHKVKTAREALVRSISAPAPKWLSPIW